MNEDAIDKSDATYKAWTTDESISMQEYLTYAISKGWLDVSKIELDTKYLDTREIMGALADYIAEYLTQDDSFSRQVYKYMIQK